MSLLEKHIELVESLNNSETRYAHDLNKARLRGFRDALDILVINQLAECDMHYLLQGIDRPMCCGEFLDWEPNIIMQITVTG